MPERPPGVEGSFLLSLADRMGLRLAVLVPRARSARHVWIAETGDAAEVAQLDRLGRHWLRATDLAAGEPAADLELGLPPDTVALAPVPDDAGHAVAVLVTLKRAGQVWAPAERDLVRFAADHYRAVLAAWLERPLPHSAVRAHDVAVAGASQAPRAGELVLDYQPELDLVTGRVLGAEALVRWNHPTRGLVGPDSFIGAAEQSGLIRALGAWVIDRSLRDLAGWLALGAPADFVLRINVSPRQIAGGDVVPRFRRALAENSVAGSRVCAEITENVWIADVDDLRTTMRELGQLGMRTALDDLATGYSSLARLRLLPVDAVKIDRELVTGIDADERGRTIVAAVLGLGAELGVEVVAEGIETAAELETLVRLGARRGQGHYLARPMPAAGIEQLLRGERSDYRVPSRG